MLTLHPPIPRRVIREVALSVLETVVFDPDVHLKPLLYYVWNGCGCEGSPQYRDGRWRESP